MSCHCDVYDVLGFGKLLGKKFLVILHLGGLGKSGVAAGYMEQQFVRLQFQFIQETSLFGTDIVRTDGYTKLVYQGIRKVAYAVRCNHKGNSLGLLKNQDIFIQL